MPPQTLSLTVSLAFQHLISCKPTTGLFRSNKITASLKNKRFHMFQLLYIDLNNVFR